jgi:hypothetical protein
MKEYNVVDSVWYDTIGIVRVRPEYGDDKFYIGSGHGHNKEVDEQHIAEWGLPYYPQALTSFFDISSK